MIPWVNYILKTGFASFTLAGNLEVSGLENNLAVQTYHVNENSCAVIFAVRTDGVMFSQLQVRPDEAPAPGSIYNGDFEEEWKDGRRITTSKWEDSYFIQEARIKDSGKPGYSMPSATVLDKQRDFILKVSLWKSSDNGLASAKAVRCDPKTCGCNEISIGELGAE